MAGLGAGPDGGWDKPPTPLWGDLIGEISFTQIDGKAVLSYFNASTGNMEVRVADDPISLSSAPVTTVVQHDEWPEPAESLPSPRRQPAGSAVRRLHFAGFDARRAAGVRQPVAQHRCAGAGAVSGDPIRGQPVQTLVRGELAARLPFESHRNSSEDLLNEARRRVPRDRIGRPGPSCGVYPSLKSA